jgi:ComF family protein
VCACDYAFPWDRLITQFKFQAQPELAGVLARLLHGAVQRAGGPLPDLVLPVPLAPARLAERGYNQSWEVARRVAALAQATPDAQVLERPLAGAHQAGLPLAERRRNLRGAFHVPPAQRTRLRGRCVALVDDVMTSGATLREAASALLAAGAARVDAWVVTRTPAPAD